MRLGTLLIAAVMTWALAACGNNDSGTTSSSGAGGSSANGGPAAESSVSASSGVGSSADSGSSGSAVATVTSGSSGTSGGTGSGGAGGSLGGTSGSGASSGSSGSSASGTGTGTGGGPPTATGPCDIYGPATPCVAAHSTVRALYGAYNGNLYQVRRTSDKMTKDIGVVSRGGVANSAAQDTFCAGTKCEITIVYDQSGKGNQLEYQGPDSSVGGTVSPAIATSESLTVSGNKVYSLYINPKSSYWRDGHATGIPLDAAPEGIYMVTSGKHVNGGCCFDYGNSETTRKADRAGAMDAIYFGTSCWFGKCTGTGPWVQADLEWGLFPGGSSTWNPKQVAFTNKFVTAMLKNNGTTRFAIKGANAQSGDLTTLWDGALPAGYNPMKKQGAIVLGSGGDCCATGNGNQSLGTFYEGAIVAGYPSDAIDGSIQGNIVAAGYQ